MGRFELLEAVERHKIALTPALGQWLASVELPGQGHNRKRAIRAVSAIASTPRQAVEQLLEQLQPEPEPELVDLEDIKW